MLKFHSKALCLVALVAASTVAVAIPAKHIPILSEGETDKDWRLASAELAPAYPPGASAADVCVNIGFFIDDDGVPTEFAHLKSWSDAGNDRKARQSLAIFEQTAVAALQARRYVPVDERHTQAIYTAQTFVFSKTPGNDAERLRRRCAIKDLESFIALAMKNADMNSWEQIRWNGEWFKAKTAAHGLNRE